MHKMQPKKDSKAELRRKVHESRIVMGERVVKSQKQYSRKGKQKFNLTNYEQE